jgi:hypothetical protein
MEQEAAAIGYPNGAKGLRIPCLETEKHSRLRSTFTEAYAPLWVAA